MRVEVEAVGPSSRAGQSESIPSFRNSRFIRLLHSCPRRSRVHAHQLDGSLFLRN
jgi:hypothetical protein